MLLSTSILSFGERACDSVRLRGGESVIRVRDATSATVRAREGVRVSNAECVGVRVGDCDEKPLLEVHLRSIVCNVAN